MDYLSYRRAQDYANSISFWTARLEESVRRVHINLRAGDHPRHPGLAAAVAATSARDACRWARALGLYGTAAA